MKKNIKVIYCIELALLLVNLIFYGLIKVIPSKYNIYLVITFLLLMVVPLRLFFGKQKNKSYYAGYTNRTIITVLMIMGMIIYALGLILSFGKGYGYNSQALISALSVTSLVLVMEYFRMLVIKNSYSNLKTIIIFTLLLAMLEIFANTSIGTLNSSYRIFIYISKVIIPIIAENFLCAYLVYKVDIGPSLIFKLTISLYMYLLPIVPNLGDYLLSVVKILTPFIIFYIINRALVEEEKSKRIITNNALKVFSIPIIVVLVMLVLLISGVFKNKLVAIASNSMAPTYYRGDAIILEKMKPEDLRKGDILVFEQSNMIITHRIVDIKKKQDKYYFTTKGDANENADGFISTSDDVIGKVDYIVKYVGFPTILVNELFERS